MLNAKFHFLHFGVLSHLIIREADTTILHFTFCILH